MTNEEAIRDLKKLKSFHNGSYGDACNMAIEALAKQMPQKPIEEQGLMTCPICGCQDIESIDASGIRQYPHCPCCSQCMDWSIDEKE